MTGHDEFLRVIRDRQEDDLPRLVYADYLDENGEELRAEFIRVSCELWPLTRNGSFHVRTRSHVNSCRRCKLDDRQSELMDVLFPDRGRVCYTVERTGYESRSLPPAALCLFSRGFVTEIGWSYDQWMEYHPLLAREPIVRVTITDQAASIDGLPDPAEFAERWPEIDFYFPRDGIVFNHRVPEMSIKEIEAAFYKAFGDLAIA